MKKDIHPSNGRLTNESDELPAKLAKPAQRALARAGITRLNQLSEITEAELAKLHGIGPNAIKLIRAALDAAGKAFAHMEAAEEQKP